MKEILIECPCQCGVSIHIPEDNPMYHVLSQLSLIPITPPKKETPTATADWEERFRI